MLTLNAVGITIEIVGASFLLVTAWKSRQKSMAHVGDNMDKIGPACDFLLDEVRGNFRNQAIGFSTITLGLLLQLMASI